LRRRPGIEPRREPGKAKVGVNETHVNPDDASLAETTALDDQRRRGERSEQTWSRFRFGAQAVLPLTGEALLPLPSSVSALVDLLLERHAGITASVRLTHA
jgi:hypothetical protein